MDGGLKIKKKSSIKMPKKDFEKVSKVQNLKITVDATEKTETVRIKTKSAPSKTDFAPVEDLGVFDDRRGEGIDLGEYPFDRASNAEKDVRFHVNLDKKAESLLFGDANEETDSILGLDEFEQDLLEDDDLDLIAADGQAALKFRNSFFDLTDIDPREFESPEAQAKRAARAKRFGIDGTAEDFSVTDEKLRSLYESLGLNPEIGEKRTAQSEKTRLDTIFVRGVEEMTTDDVIEYFSEYSPIDVEWINDRSCNVVWPDKRRAGKAMLTLGRPLRRIRPPKGEQEEGEVSSDEEKEDSEEYVSPMKRVKNAKATGQEETKNDNEEKDEENPENDETMHEKSEDVEENEEEGNKEKKLDDDDVLMLGVDEQAVTEIGKDVEKAKKPDGKESPVLCVDNEKPIDVDMKEHSLPPGKWRVGSKPTDQAALLLFRFATIQDVKLPGAQHESSFYRKYGNPNFGGTQGLISESRKRRMGMPGRNHWSGGDRGDLRSRLDSRRILKGRRRRSPPEYFEEEFEETAYPGYPSIVDFGEQRSRSPSPDESDLEKPRPRVKQPPRMKMRADEEQSRPFRKHRLGRPESDDREWSPFGGYSTPPAYVERGAQYGDYERGSYEDWDAPERRPARRRPGDFYEGDFYEVDEDFDYNEEFLKDDEREQDLPDWKERGYFKQKKNKEEEEEKREKKKKWTPPPDLKRMKVTVENA